MSSMFYLIFFIFVVNSIKIRQQTEDEHPFTSDDENKSDKFMLIPSIGYEINDQPGEFNLILNGWYYKPLNLKFLQTIFTSSLQLALYIVDTNEKFSDKEKQERLGPFFVHDVQGHNIQLKLSTSIIQTVVTDENGRFNEKITVNSLDGLNIKNQILKYIASDDNDNNDQQATEGIIFLMKIRKPHGCSIISDIDDTIKISEVPDKQKLIVNTFKKDFQAVPGMSDLYQSWQSSHKCLIHYVSAMPAQLYYVTQKFLNKEKFPRGSFHMRHLKLVSTEQIQLIQQILEFTKRESSRKHKLIVIKTILDYAPLTQEFVMVGDSGELDPEIYGEIAQDYPERIKMIFIRLVDGGQNDQNRFEEAFKNIPNNKWKTFSDAEELPKKLYEDTDPINENITNDDDNNNNNNNNNNISRKISLSISLFFILLILIYI